MSIAEVKAKAVPILKRHGARRAGLSAVWLDRLDAGLPVAPRIRDLGELPGLLRCLDAP